MQGSGCLILGAEVTVDMGYVSGCANAAYRGMVVGNAIYVYGVSENRADMADLDENEHEHGMHTQKSCIHLLVQVVVVRNVFPLIDAMSRL